MVSQLSAPPGRDLPDVLRKKESPAGDSSPWIRLPNGVLIMDETSAEPNIPGERAIPLDEDHISICKPSSPEAQLYKSISRFLNQCLEAISHPQ
jgi:hypothetical protein